MEACSCPTCGQLLPDHALRVDLEGGVLVAGGSFCQLTKQEAALFQVLWEGRGRIHTKERIMDALYSLLTDEEEPAEKIVDVYICKLRKKLKGLPVVIETVWGRGFRVIPVEEVKKAS